MIAMLGLIGLLRAGTSGDGMQTMAPATQPSAVVKIDSFAFQPKVLEITAGTRVTWQNADDVPHTASSKGEVSTFDSGALDTDETFSFTFARPGTYPYFCKVHPHMTGTIVVK